MIDKIEATLNHLLAIKPCLPSISLQLPKLQFSHYKMHIFMWLEQTHMMGIPGMPRADTYTALAPHPAGLAKNGSMLWATKKLL